MQIHLDSLSRQFLKITRFQDLSAGTGSYLLIFFGLNIFKKNLESQALSGTVEICKSYPARRVGARLDNKFECSSALQMYQNSIFPGLNCRQQKSHKIYLGVCRPDNNP